MPNRDQNLSKPPRASSVRRHLDRPRSKSKARIRISHRSGEVKRRRRSIVMSERRSASGRVAIRRRMCWITSSRQLQITGTKESRDHVVVDG